MNEARLPETIWRPRPDDMENSNVARFMRRQWIPNAAILRERAANEPNWFYPAIIEDLGIEWFAPYERLYEEFGITADDVVERVKRLLER